MGVDLVVVWALVGALVGHVEGICERFLDVVISMMCCTISAEIVCEDEVKQEKLPMRKVFSWLQVS